MPARRKSPNSDAPGAAPTFEAAYAELEEIVAAMEEEQLPLEELVARYEKGSKLLSHCESVLASARQRLHTINARTSAEDVETDDETDLPDEVDHRSGTAAGTPDEHDDDDDIRLF